MRERIVSTLESLAAQLAASQEEVKRLLGGIEAVASLISHSRGVIGLHMNDDEAPWDDLLEGGRFEAWLRDFSAATKEPTR